MVNTLMRTSTPSAVPSTCVRLEQLVTAPTAAGYGSGLSAAGTSGAAAATGAFGAHVTDLPGSPPRGAPV